MKASLTPVEWECPGSTIPPRGHLDLGAFDFGLERGQRLIPELIEPGAQRAEALRVE